MKAEPRSAQEALDLIRKQEHAARRQQAFQRMEVRAAELFLPDNNDAKAATTGYVAVQRKDVDGNLLPVYKIGKPKTPNVDMTERGGGPYDVNVEAATCTCPQFEKTQQYEGRGLCKHLLGLTLWLATVEVRAAPSGRLVWGKRKVEQLTMHEIGAERQAA